MGNLCSATVEHDDISRQSSYISNNYLLTKILVSKFATLSIIYGHYNLHFGQTLLCFSTSKQLERLDELRDYGSEYRQTCAKLKCSSQMVCEVKAKKNCPYKKLLICMLPEYVSTDSEKYIKLFNNALKEIIATNQEFTIFLSTVGDEGGPIANQMMLALLFRHIECCLVRDRNINLISADKKILQMIKYEIIKTEAWEGSFEWSYEHLY